MRRWILYFETLEEAQVERPVWRGPQYPVNPGGLLPVSGKGLEKVRNSVFFSEGRLARSFCFLGLENVVFA